MTINEERMELGIAALLSGEHLKGTAYLHQVDEEGVHRKCCLGVLTLVAIANGLNVSREMIPAARLEPAHERFGGKPDELMCKAVMEWYGFTESDPCLVTSSGDYRNASLWNDNGWAPDSEVPAEEGFTEIAKGFRRTFLEKK